MRQFIESDWRNAGARRARPTLRMDWHDARVFLVLTAVGLLLVLPALIRDGLESTASIDLVSAVAVVATVWVATRRARADALRIRLLRGWLATRGVLYVLISAPLLAVVVGFFLGLVSYPVASYSVLVAAAVLPIWVSHRIQHSADPDEPIHHLAKYGRNAVVPVVVFTIVRIPMFYIFGIPYWHPWYAFGNAFTGAPLDQLGSMAAGAALYFLQGFALAIGFYVLFREHSLLNAVLYLAVWDVGLYSYVFPLTRLGMETPVLWHVNNVYAHLCMAIALWGVPYTWSNLWPKMTGLARISGWGVLGAALVLPFAFAALQASVWQFPLEHTIDQATFDRHSLISVVDGPKVIIDGADTQYIYRFSFGPRLYRTWAGATRALKADELHISGRLFSDGAAIAWCSNDISRLEGPPTGRDPVAFRNALRDLEFAQFEVSCVGPATDSSRAATPDLQWHATVEFIGERDHASRSFGTY